MHTNIMDNRQQYQQYQHELLSGQRQQYQQYQQYQHGLLPDQFDNGLPVESTRSAPQEYAYQCMRGQHGLAAQAYQVGAAMHDTSDFSFPHSDGMVSGLAAPTLLNVDGKPTRRYIRESNDAKLLHYASSQAVSMAKNIFLAGGSEKTARDTALAAARSILIQKKSRFFRRRKLYHQASLLASMAIVQAKNECALQIEEEMHTKMIAEEEANPTAMTDCNGLVTSVETIYSSDYPLPPTPEAAKEEIDIPMFQPCPLPLYDIDQSNNSRPPRAILVDKSQMPHNQQNRNMYKYKQSSDTLLGYSNGMHENHRVYINESRKMSPVRNYTREHRHDDDVMFTPIDCNAWCM